MPTCCSPLTPIALLLGRALAESRCPQASAELLRLLGDPHLNVRTMALEVWPSATTDPRCELS